MSNRLYYKNEENKKEFEFKEGEEEAEIDLN